MSNKYIYNVGTTVYYEGDDTLKPGFGRITKQTESYLGDGEIELEITLEDGRTFYPITPADFESRTVLGNTAPAEFYIAEGDLVSELDDYTEEEVFYNLSY
jgi:hypothetical protein